jgi:uncharacterized protein
VLVEVKVQSLGLDRSSNTPVVVLRELAGERVLPIWIGPGEASAIAMQLAEMTFGRPLTHDLLVSVLRGLGGTLRKVVITRVEENTYFAELQIHRDGEVVRVDARPSDSIAVALRTRARIFADDELLELMQLEIADEEAAPPPGPAPSGSSPLPGVTGGPGAGSTPREGGGSISEGMTPEELEAYLRKLDPEDFGRFTP